MKNIASLAAGAAALGLTGVALADDDDIVTKNFDFTGFERIEIAGVYELDVRVGPDYSIELSGSEHEMNRVEVSLKDGELRLNQRNRKFGEKKRRNNDGVEAVITLPSLVALEVSGVVDGTVSDIDAGNFEVDLSGVGDLTLDGECGSLDANLSGVGDLDAKALECNIVEVRVSGVGEASVYASEEVDARVSGMGDIDVYGSPSKVSKSSSMFAEVTIH